MRPVQATPSDHGEAGPEAGGHAAPPEVRVCASPLHPLRGQDTELRLQTGGQGPR